MIEKWVHGRKCVDLGETVVYYLLIGEMICLGRWDEFPMVNALVCMVTH